MKKIRFDRNDIKLITDVSGLYVNKKNGTVCVSVKWELCVPDWLYNMDFVCPGIIGEGLVGETRGVAVCLPGDAFDEKVGERVARAKAESKAYSAATNAINAISDAINEASARIDEMVLHFNVKSVKVQKHNVEYIKRIS